MTWDPRNRRRKQTVHHQSAEELFRIEYESHVTAGTCTISNRPHFVPMSSSRISSVLPTIVAPTARPILLLSVLRMRRRAVMLALTKWWQASSDSPFSVTTTSGLKAMISSQIFFTYSSSACAFVRKSTTHFAFMLRKMQEVPGQGYYILPSR